jgi:integrase
VGKDRPLGQGDHPVASIIERDTKAGRRFDVKWRDHGDPKQHTRTFHSREAAREHVRKVERAHDERRPYLDAPPPAPVLTLAGLATAYLVDRKRVSRSAAGLAQRALALSMFIGWIDETDGETPEPRHLSRGRLAAYHAWLLSPRLVAVEREGARAFTQPVRCGVATANARVRYVEAWWRWLSDSDDYPEGAIPRPKRIDLATPPAPPDPVAPTWAEMDAAIDCGRPSWRRLLTLMRCTGLRTTQAMRLRRDDVDLDAATLRIRGELGKSRQERAGRTVPITASLVDAIRGWPEDPAGWLILWEAPTRAHGSVNARRPSYKTARGILERAGVRREVWELRPTEDGGRRNAHPLHCMRAGFITGLARLGVEQAVVKRLVGHSRGVTGDRYTDAEVLEMREAVARIPIIAPRAGGRVLTLRDYKARRE